jgi:hypothetical protein
MMSTPRLFFGLRRDASDPIIRPAMSEKTVTLKLNQQQLELLDRTIAQGAAPDRVSLVRLALHEYAANRTTAQKPGTP